MSLEVVFYVIFLLILSAVCSGLNIALISLNPDELRHKARLGNRHAKRVLPLRNNAHLSLASILLTNVAAVSATSLVLEHSFNGIIAGLMTTLLVVILGELAPQALFTKHALTACSYLSPALRLMIALTYVVSKPLQIALDKIFGTHDQKRLHSRHELGLIISDHLDEPESELDDDEIEIIRGALQLSEKQVADIMTPIDKVFWLNPATNIDSLVIDKIKEEGHSRIPIFDSSLNTCYGVLLMKELVDIDFDEESHPVTSLRLHKTKSIGSRTALDTMFRHFIAARTHLMPVTQNGDIIGIITIEDLLEEIIGHEIVDESDENK